MEFLHQLFFLALLLPLVSCINPIYEKCSQNFTNNNILQDNINKVYNELIANTPSNGYAISTIGDGNNAVYGLTHCRGDIGAQDCSDCIVAAAQKLQAICPNSAAARIWYELCFIRYDTNNFIGNLDISDAQLWFVIMEIANSQFNVAVWNLLSWLKVTATSGSNKFGMGEMSTINGTITIYGIVQCTHDLQGSICLECLEAMTTEVTNYCKNHTGCIVMSSSCVMRYEIYNFLLAKSIPAYPGSSASAPPPAPISSTLV